jgi:hypothetical protein
MSSVERFFNTKAMSYDDALASEADLANAKIISIHHLFMWHESISREYSHYVGLSKDHASRKRWSKKFQHEMKSFDEHLRRAWKLCQTPHERLTVIEMGASLRQWSLAVMH